MPAPKGRDDVNEFSFTLALDASHLDDAQIRALYAGVPDTTVTERNERAYVGIDRRGTDFAAAVVTAIEDVERALVPIRVVALEPEDLVSQADIAQRQGRSRESISQLVNGERGPGTFPQPKYFVADRGLWRWPEVERWFDTYEGGKARLHHDAFVDAVNAILAIRQRQPALAPAELTALRRLAEDTELARI